MEIIFEDEEIIYEFFEENKKQLEFYKSLFNEYDQTHDLNIIKIIRKNIKKNYIPNLNTCFLTYKCIRKNKHCKGFKNSICYLSKIDKDFLYCLSVLLNEITKFNILN
jgi:hypothetical protein